MKREPKIPKGWEMLYPHQLVRDGDERYGFITQSWTPCKASIGQRVGLKIIIRPVRKAAGHG